MPSADNPDSVIPHFDNPHLERKTMWQLLLGYLAVQFVLKEEDTFLFLPRYLSVLETMSCFTGPPKVTTEALF